MRAEVQQRLLLETLIWSPYVEAQRPETSTIDDYYYRDFSKPRRDAQLPAEAGYNVVFIDVDQEHGRGRDASPRIYHNN